MRKPGMPGQCAVDDEVGHRQRRLHPQEDRLDHGDETVVGVGVEGFVEDAGLVRDVEHRCHAVVDERRPQVVEVRVGQGPSVHGGRARSWPGARRSTRVRPVGPPARPRSRRVRCATGMQPSLALGHDGCAPAVPRAHVGGQGGQRLRKSTLPQQPEVGEQHGLVEAHDVEVRGPGRRVPVVRGELLVVVGTPGPGRSRRRWRCAAQHGGVTGYLHVGHVESLPPPGEPGVAELVVDDGQRLVL